MRTRAGKREGRRLVRSRALAVRMGLLVVLIPAFVVAAVAAIVVLVPAHLLFGLVIAVVVGLGLQAYSSMRRRDRQAARHVLAREEDPELFVILERLSALLDIDPPQVVASELEQANSWVIHRPGAPPQLFITRRLRDLLTLDELQAVLAHELTHIANRDALVMTVVGMPGTVLLSARGGGVGGALLLLVGGVSNLGTSMLSRLRELTADAGAAAITARPSALASALLKVSDSQGSIPTADLRAAQALNAFNLVAVTARRRRRRWHDRLAPLQRPWRSHPDLTDRLEQLRRLEHAQHSPRA